MGFHQLYNIVPSNNGYYVLGKDGDKHVWVNKADDDSEIPLLLFDTPIEAQIYINQQFAEKEKEYKVEPVFINKLLF